jgi:Leucine-rich repeat (LRR) protein
MFSNKKNISSDKIITKSFLGRAFILIVCFFISIGISPHFDVLYTNLIEQVSFAAAVDEENINVVINGKELEFDVPPLIINGRAVLPLRTVFNELSAKVDWDGSTQTITATKNSTIIIVQINNKIAKVNNIEKTLEVPPIIIDGRTMVPLRFIAESFNASVNWDDGTRLISIISQNLDSNFKDLKLLKAIKERIGKLEEPLLEEDLSKITTLDLSSKNISNIEGLYLLKNLIEINLSNNQILDISPLENLVNLKVLNLSQNNISSVSILKSFTNLTKLDISNNSIYTVPEIKNLKKLTSLKLCNNKIYNISPIDEIISNLKETDVIAIKFNDPTVEAEIRKKLNILSGNIYNVQLEYITFLDFMENKINSIDVLKHCTNLEVLSFAGYKTDYSDTLKNLRNLKKLYLRNDRIYDLSFLKELKNLSVLYIQSAYIKDISVISDLKELAELDLFDNSISDISAISNLKNLEELTLSHNEITDITPLGELHNLKKLDLYYNTIYDLTPIRKLSKIKHFNFMHFKTEEPFNDETFNKYALMKDKVSEIIGKVIKPGFTELEKEIAIHDYVVSNARYDNINYKANTVSDESHSHYGILINGTGVCDGYAKTMKILLNAVGIECQLVFGDSIRPMNLGKHAWNIVKIDGKYYHLDATFNDPVSDDDSKTLVHTYFNLSDQQMSIDHLYNKEDYPPCNDDNNTLTNELENRKRIGNKIFSLEDNKIYIKQENEIHGREIINDNVFSFSIDEEYVYYGLISDGPSFGRIKFDGSEQKFICGLARPKFIFAKDNYLFYLNTAMYFSNQGNESQIIRVDKNGDNGIFVSEKNEIASWFTIYKDYLIYKSFDWTKNKANLYKIPLNNIVNMVDNSSIQNRTEVTPDGVSGFLKTAEGSVRYVYQALIMIVSDWVYYSNSDDNNCLYRIKLDGTERTKITNASSTISEILGDYIYYVNDVDQKYYRVNTDGSNNFCLE